MNMFAYEGSWWIRSKSDPRWDEKGRSPVVGGFVMPEECKRAIEQKKITLGEPPEDLTWNYMKD
jgi:hypothetical protein